MGCLTSIIFQIFGWCQEWNEKKRHTTWDPKQIGIPFEVFNIHSILKSLNLSKVKRFDFWKLKPQSSVKVLHVVLINVELSFKWTCQQLSKFINLQLQKWPCMDIKMSIFCRSQYIFETNNQVKRFQTAPSF